MKREELKQKSGTEYRCLKCGQHWDYDDDACPECGSRNIEAYLIRIKCDVSAGKNVTKSHVNTDKNVTNDPPPAEGAEEIIESIVEGLGDPINIHNHIFEIRPYTVEHKTEWWIFHKEVESGEPLTQWLSKFAALHARKMAEEMVEKQMPSNKQIHERPIQGYQPLDKLDTSTPPCEVVLDAKGGFSADE